MKGWLAVFALLTLMTAGCGDRVPFNPAAIEKHDLSGADEGSNGGQVQQQANIDAGEQKVEAAAAANDDAPSIPLPDEIKLIFKPLELEKLQQGGPSSGWKLNKTIPFGQVDGEPVSLDIYTEEPKDSYTSTMVYGVLQVHGITYVIRDLSHDFISDVSIDSPIYEVFGQLFDGQRKYVLIGAVEMFANGPGLKMYVVRDVESGELSTFSDWGEPSILDLNGDGIDEFVIEFQGLHMSWPDLTLVKAEGGKLEKSGSVLEAIRRNGWKAALKREQTPIIEISNVWEESPLVYRYVYKQGTLVRIDGP